jgi:serine/threonine protein kinase
LAGNNTLQIVAEKVTTLDELAKINANQPEDAEHEAGEAGSDASSAKFLLFPSFAERVRIEGYELLELLGQGGAGVVFRAKQRMTGRVVAIKVVNLNGSNPASNVRFQQEARALCKFSHPNVVSIYDFGINADGLPFIVMENLSGNTLAELIGQNGQIPWDTAIRYFVQICDALEHAHAHGVIHRDLKPSNIMVLHGENTNRQIKVFDFGIAKLFTDTQPSMNLTATGQIFGSPFYMSPEQCEGLKVDKRSDVYSLGCVMYEVLSGRPPHTGENPFSVAVKHMQSKPEPLSAARSDLRLPARLESIVLRALEKNVESRFQSMAELRAELNDLTDKRLFKRITRGSHFVSPKSARSFGISVNLIALSIVLILSVFTIGIWLVKQIDKPLTATKTVNSSPLADHSKSEQLPPKERVVDKSRSNSEEALRTQIASALPVSTGDIEKAIAASAILPGDLAIQVSQSKSNPHAITVKTTRYQATQKEMETDALLVADRVLSVDPNVSSLSVYFTYPGDPSAYDEIPFNQGQLRTLAKSGLRDPKLLRSINVVVSGSAKKVDSPQAAANQSETAAALGLLKQMKEQGARLAEQQFGQVRHAGPAVGLTEPVGQGYGTVGASSGSTGQSQPRSPGAANGDLTDSVRQLEFNLPGAKTEYLVELAQAFQRSQVPLPTSKILQMPRFRIALRLLVMEQNNQNIQPYLRTYKAMEGIGGHTDMTQLRSLEQSLGLDPWRAEYRSFYLDKELRMLKWPRYQ